jgi:hypothetical protein
MNAAAPDKVEMIERSLRCFACGLIGLLPVIGIPFALIAIGNFFRVYWGQRSIWNPAERYARVGLVCAVAGLMIETLLAAVIYIEAS